MEHGEFLSAIKDLTRLGQASGNELALSDIREYFEKMELNEKQIDDICKYLQAQNLHIKNWIPGSAGETIEEEIVTSEDPLDKNMVDIYLAETARSSSLTPDQERTVAKKLANGDENARNLLIEANLAYAVQIAREYEGKGLLLSDLIQESNIGLMIAVNDYEPGLHGSFHEFAGKHIRDYLESAISEYNRSTRSAMKMASRVNELNEITTAFAREYEREAKPYEIAQRMGITEEEVKELMKVSLDAIAVLDQGKIG